MKAYNLPRISKRYYEARLKQLEASYPPPSCYEWAYASLRDLGSVMRCYVSAAKMDQLLWMQSVGMVQQGTQRHAKWYQEYNRYYPRQGYRERGCRRLKEAPPRKATYELEQDVQIRDMKHSYRVDVAGYLAYHLQTPEYAAWKAEKERVEGRALTSTERSRKRRNLLKLKKLSIVS
jgi:hypothetical protein